MLDSEYFTRYERETAKAIYSCEECGYMIFEGEGYYKIEEITICEECIDKFKRICGEE